jgi:hypothetical protein
MVMSINIPLIHTSGLPITIKRDMSENSRPWSVSARVGDMRERFVEDWREMWPRSPLLGESAIVPRWSVSFLSRGPRSLHLPMSHQCSQLLSADCSGMFAVGLLALIGALLGSVQAGSFLSLCYRSWHSGDNSMAGSVLAVSG